MSVDDAQARAAQGSLAEEVRSWLAANWQGTEVFLGGADAHREALAKRIGI